MTNAFDSMDLNTAYEIAGGYIEADDEIFAKALEMVKADDARFAEELKAARKAETSLKAQQDKEEEIAASAEEVLDNTSFLKQEFGNDKFQQDFFADEEIKAAEKNTPVYDINPETQERFELEGDDKHAHFEMLFEKAKLDVWREQAGSKEFHNLKNKDKKKDKKEFVATNYNSIKEIFEHSIKTYANKEFILARFRMPFMPYKKKTRTFSPNRREVCCRKFRMPLIRTRK